MDEKIGTIEFEEDEWDVVEVTPYGVQVVKTESDKDTPYDVGDETVFTRNMSGFDSIKNRKNEEFVNLPQFIDHIMDERRS